MSLLTFLLVKRTDMINSHSVQKEVVRLRTRSSFHNATKNTNMRRTTRQTPATSSPTANSPSETDVDDVRANSPIQSISLQAFSSDSDKLDSLCCEMAKIAGLAQEIKELKRSNAEKDKRINELETRIEDLEQYSRQDNLIITGFNYQHLSYSGAANPNQDVFNHENSTEQERISLEDQVVNMLQNHDIPIDKNSISACHTIPNKHKPSERPIVIRFTNRKAKIRVLQNSRKLKKVRDSDVTNVAHGSGIFINEHLTTKNNMIAKKARYMKKEGKIEQTWVRNCKIFVKYKTANGDFKVKMVKSVNELNAFSS